MRAAVISEPGRLEVTEVDDPRPGVNEAIIRVEGCGVCGSDLHTISVFAPPGSVMGHEIAGVVEAVGPGADPSVVGRSVAVRPFTGCGSCTWCETGRADHCASFGLVGFERPGGFAELVAVDAGELYSLPASVSPTERALVEPLAIARHALRRAGSVAGEDAAVLGAGPIGLAVVSWLRRFGARSIVVSDPSPVRRELAVTLGADTVVDPLTPDGRDALASAARSGGGHGPAAVFECSGRPGLIGEAMGLAAIEGRVVVVGLCVNEDRFVPWAGMQKDLDIRFVIYYGRNDYVDTIDDLASGDLVAGPMVTERIGLSALPERFSRLASDADAGKVIVDPTLP